MLQVSVKIFRRKNTSRNTKNCFPILISKNQSISVVFFANIQDRPSWLM